MRESESSNSDSANIVVYHTAVGVIFTCRPDRKIKLCEDSTYQWDLVGALHPLQKLFQPPKQKEKQRLKQVYLSKW